MPDNRFGCNSPGGSSNGSGGREMVCIETNRILDSCKDRDCFENVRVFLTDFGNEVIERTGSVRVRGANVAWVYVGIDPLAFNRGFYTVTIRFFVKICCEACLGPGRAQEFEGIAVAEKRVILYGSESNVSIFRSNPDACDYCTPLSPAGNPRNVPIAVIETVDPIVLQAKVAEEPPVYDCSCSCSCCSCCADIPENVAAQVDGNLSDGQPGSHVLLVSFGLFSIIRLVRPAEYLVSASEYVIPDKECVAAEEDNPCALFRSMAFPTREFSPPSYPTPPTPEHGGRCGCN